MCWIRTVCFSTSRNSLSSTGKCVGRMQQPKQHNACGCCLEGDWHSQPLEAAEMFRTSAEGRGNGQVKPIVHPRLWGKVRRSSVYLKAKQTVGTSNAFINKKKVEERKQQRAATLGLSLMPSLLGLLAVCLYSPAKRAQTWGQQPKHSPFRQSFFLRVRVVHGGEEINVMSSEI